MVSMLTFVDIERNRRSSWQSCSVSSQPGDDAARASPWVGLTAATPSTSPTTTAPGRGSGRRRSGSAGPPRSGIPVPRPWIESPDWLITRPGRRRQGDTGRAYVEAAIAAAQGHLRRHRSAAQRAGAGAGPRRRAARPAPSGSTGSCAARCPRPSSGRPGRRPPRSPGTPWPTATSCSTTSSSTPPATAVTVIDWEYLTYRPRRLRPAHALAPADRGRGPGAGARRGAARRPRPAGGLGVLHHWLAVRYLADLVTRFRPVRVVRGTGSTRR